MQFELALIIAGWSVAVVWLVVVLPAAFGHWLRRLNRLAGGLPDPDHWPKVSVVVAARNEAERIEACLESLRASDYPDLELILVNDRSEDDTGEIMNRLASVDNRIHVIEVTELPSDWLGKNHAMARGAAVARGEFLLFTDGDVLFTTDVIGIAIRCAVARKLDHLTLSPTMLAGGYPEMALLAMLGMAFTTALQPWLARRFMSRFGAGIGAFNLVRRRFYEQVGGHEPIAFDVVDDLKLGRLIKNHNGRSDLLNAGDRLSVRWQNSAWQTITGLEKNGFAGFNYSVLLLVQATLAASAALYLPIAAVILAPVETTAGFAVAVVLQHVCYTVAARSLGVSWFVAPCLLPASAAMLFTIWRSMVITLRQGGVRWRDTFYPLDKLKSRQYL